jgi:phage recombination protein Bet
MNAIVEQPAATLDEVMRVLENSLYPGAKPASIQLVLSYCKMNGLDPLLKPVHIVPTSVKVGPDKYEWRDVLMPGIADYRIKAARSGDYVGKSEPDFGPDVTEDIAGVRVTYPQWCRVSVQRFVRGEVRAFTAREYWLENYATAGAKTEAPNRMWRKRPYGQLAKCAEAQALRMAFPEFSGGIPTAEEMEGKTFAGPTIEHEPEPPPAAPEPKQTRRGWLDAFITCLREARDVAEVEALLRQPKAQEARRTFQNGLKAELEAAIDAAMAAHAPVVHQQDEPPGDDWGGWPGDPAEMREREAAV